MIRQAIFALALTLTFGAGLLAPPQARAGELLSDKPDGAEMAFDGLVVRPVGIVATALGAATWVVILPFTLLSGDVEAAGDTLVADPAQFTFVRPLGEF